MTTIRPATLHRAEDPRLSDLAGRVVGARVVAVRYAMLAGVDWDGRSSLDGVHEVDLAVLLVTDSGLTLELAWATPGTEEGLSIAVLGAGERVSDDLVDMVDISGDPHWAAVLGRVVETLAVSFYEHADDSSIRPWSFRVGVSGGTGVTVALGEVAGDEIIYMPDNLVVIFDEPAARAYAIEGATESAWGAAIT
jgi:hypothetical protein